jgi:hypothetical protein
LRHDEGAVENGVRAARTSIDPITRDAMHAALLLFPEHARLSFDLSAWVVSSY